MKTINNNLIAVFFSALFMGCTILASCLQEPMLLFLPLGLLGACYLVQHLNLLFYVLMVAIPWSVEYNFNGSLGTDLPDEPLMLLTAISVLLWLICKRHVPSPKIHFLSLFIFLQLLWVIVTVCLSTNVLVSIKYLLAKSWYLLAFLSAPLILFQDVMPIKRAFQLLLFSSVTVIIVVLIKHAQLGFTFEKVNIALSPWFRNHVNYSALVVCLVPVSMALYKLTNNRFRKRIYTAIVLLLLIALALSYSRGAWLAFVTGIMAYWLLRRKALFLTYCFFILFCISAILWLRKEDRYVQFSRDFNTTIFHKDFREHLIATYELKDMSTTERFYRWIAAVRMAGDAWPAGFGPTTFYDHYKDYTVPAFKTWVSNNEEHSTVHNYFLLLLAEQGVIGLLLFAILLGAMFWYTQLVYHRTSDFFWKVIISSMAVMLMMICTIIFLSDMIETDKLGSLFYICLAMIITADRKTSLYPASDIERVS